MQRTRRIVVAALVAATSPLARGIDEPATTAVQWAAEDGGNGHWYEVIARPYATYNWSETREEAISRGGDLVELQYEEEWVFLSPLVQKLDLQLLAGGTRLAGGTDPTDGWNWVDGSSFGYQAWAPETPNNSISQDLVLCLGGQGWDDWRIEDYSNGYMIEYAADCNGDGIVDYGQILDGTFDDKNGNGVPDCCDAGEPCDGGESLAVQWKVEDGGNGHWYGTINTPMTWYDARQEANQRSADLVSVTSMEEFQFLSDAAMLSAENKFTGGYQDLNAEDYAEPFGGWRWSSGEYFDWSVLSEYADADDCPGGTPGYCGCGPDGMQNKMMFCCFGSSAQLDDIGDAGNGGCDSINRASVIEWSADCNGDGIVDYGQILDGTFEDLDGNGVPDCCEDGGDCLGCPADIYPDGVVDSIDLLVLLAYYGLDDPGPADVDGDGDADADDILAVIAAWGECE